MSKSEERPEASIGLCAGFKKPVNKTVDSAVNVDNGVNVDNAVKKKKAVSNKRTVSRTKGTEETSTSFRRPSSASSHERCEEKSEGKSSAPGGGGVLKNRSWRVPESDVEAEKIILPTAEELETIRKAAYSEGFNVGKKQGHKAGYDKGIKDGQQEMDATMARLKQVMQALYEPIHQQDEALESILLDSVIAICRLILKRELKIDSSQIMTILKSAIDTLGVGYKNLKIHLHPRDAQLIEEKLKTFSDYNEAWRIIEHATLSPGGCIVETETSLLNATVDQRVKQVVQQIYDQEVLHLPGHADEILIKEERFISDSFSEIADEIADEGRMLPESQDPILALDQEAPSVVSPEALNNPEQKGGQADEP